MINSRIFSIFFFEENLKEKNLVQLKVIFYDFVGHD